jgi:hypothetical protein
MINDYTLLVLKNIKYTTIKDYTIIIKYKDNLKRLIVINYTNN